MRRIAKILSFICLAVFVAAAPAALQRLPADTGAYVAKKYDGWSGVLRCRVYSSWSCAGSFVSWLNGCAAGFEKAHEGVYIEFQTMDNANGLGAVRTPDMMVFSAGVLDDYSIFTPMEATGLRSSLEAAGRSRALPIAMGGYIRVENLSAVGFAIPEEYAAPLIAMARTDAQSQPLPESGLDLGLPAFNAADGITFDADAFQRFVNGEAGGTVVNQKQLARLIALRDSGRGPDWSCAAPGRYAWCDQLLMLGVVQGEGEVESLCREFAQSLLTEANQRALAEIGAFPVAGISIYGGFSSYRAMEEQLLGGTLLLPKDEHSDAAAGALVRKLNAGEISAAEAAENLAQACR